MYFLLPVCKEDIKVTSTFLLLPSVLVTWSLAVRGRRAAPAAAEKSGLESECGGLPDVLGLSHVSSSLALREAWFLDWVNSDLKRTDVCAGKMAESSHLHLVNWLMSVPKALPREPIATVGMRNLDSTTDKAEHLSILAL